MKAALEKAVNTLRFNSRSMRTAESEQDLHALQTTSHDHLSLQNSLSPVSAVEYTTMGADDVLFRKNNVLLKCPAKSCIVQNANSNATSYNMHSTTQSKDSNAVDVTTSLDNHTLIPGFLFVTTRGSNFGTTLILNWAPNSSMVVPSSFSNTSVMSINKDCLEDSGEVMDRSDYPPNTGYHSSLSQYVCSSVSIDLCLMEMIRIFYRMDDKGFMEAGELVVKSKEQEFKVFYFKNGGLSDLVHIFHSWKYFSHTCHSDAHCHTFTVFCPKLSLFELHPLESKISSSLTKEMWASLKDFEGHIIDAEYVRKVVFFQGVTPSLRRKVWPFLLNVYTFDIGDHEREELQEKYKKEYFKIKQERLCLESVTDEGVGAIFAAKRDQILKDVVRTDRSNPYYKGDDNRHLDALLNIILNYLHYKPEISYTQGMTDLLAPLLAVLDDEVEAFWCFTKLMQSSAIFKPGKDLICIKHQLEYLNLLIEMLIPSFHQYLEQTEGGLTLMFCHRWLLVLLKREFDESDILMIWEACWTQYETKSFHLFLCIAILAIYGQKAIDKQMNIDELMVYFNTLSLQMPREIVMSQARGYLHQFCKSKQVNCVLHELMDRSFWQRKDSPQLCCSECKGFDSCSRTGFLTNNKEVIC